MNAPVIRAKGELAIDHEIGVDVEVSVDRMLRISAAQALGFFDHCKLRSTFLDAADPTIVRWLFEPSLLVSLMTTDQLWFLEVCDAA
jgi:hypothetical protein